MGTQDSDQRVEKVSKGTLALENLYRVAIPGKYRSILGIIEGRQFENLLEGAEVGKCGRII